jgi:hypothetical protein
MIERMRWIPDGYNRLVSGCGRFEVGGVIYTPAGTGYVRLYDRTSDKEYPCRTLASAKAAAKNLLNLSGDGVVKPVR